MNRTSLAGAADRYQVRCLEWQEPGASAHTGRVRDHTSLRAWQEAHAISVAVIRLARSSWKPYASALFNQLQRASLSVQLNIAEGYPFGDSPTFTRHLGIAYGSAVEQENCCGWPGMPKLWLTSVWKHSCCVVGRRSACCSACSNDAGYSLLRLLPFTVFCSLCTVHCSRFFSPPD